MPAAFPEPRLSLPGSGLYASIVSVRRGQTWRSSSAVGVEAPLLRDVGTGHWRYEVARAGGRDYLAVATRVSWSGSAGPVPLVLSVFEDKAEFDREIAVFERTSWAWLGGAALLLFAGNLSDRIGAKKAMALGIALFGVTSAACAFAPTTALLIAARCAQGAGAAIMLPASMSLVREAFPHPARRAKALGVWAVGGAVAGLVGQPLGGLLTTFDWRWVFGINIPVCAAMLVLLAKVATSPTRPSPFDLAGQILGCSP